MNDKSGMRNYIGDLHFEALRSEADRVSLYGTSVKDMTIDELKATIGFVLKNSPLYFGLDMGKEN